MEVKRMLLARARRARRTVHYNVARRTRRRDSLYLARRQANAQFAGCCWPNNIAIRHERAATAKPGGRGATTKRCGARGESSAGHHRARRLRED